MQICCTVTLTLSLNMIFTNDDDDDDDYKDHQFTTTTTEHSFCLSLWSSWSSRDMVSSLSLLGCTRTETPLEMALLSTPKTNLLS